MDEHDQDRNAATDQANKDRDQQKAEFDEDAKRNDALAAQNIENSKATNALNEEQVKSVPQNPSMLLPRSLGRVRKMTQAIWQCLSH
jgi:hypothetical protein